MQQRLPDDERAKELVKASEASFDTHQLEVQSVLARLHRPATLGQLIYHAYGVDFPQCLSDRQSIPRAPLTGG